MSEENNEETSLQRDQTTQDFLTGLKEREELKSKLHEKERECNTLKGAIYDMTKKVEDLEKQLAEKNQNKETKKRRPSSARKPKRPAQKKREKGGKDGGLLAPAEVNNKDSHDNPFEDPEKLYQEIATRYPDVPLSTILIAEKKFVEADLDRNGTIDSDELEKMLDLVSQQGGTGFLYTKKEIENIFRKIDLDKTNSIDFFECIEVLEMIRQNRIKDLPIATSMQQNKSAVCSIQ